MRKNLNKFYILTPIIFFLVALSAFSAIVVITTHAASSPWSAVTTSYAHVRTDTNIHASVVATYAPNTHVTVYATVSGQVVWENISAWYRISSLSSAPRYIYGSLLNRVSGGSTPTPIAQGHVIIVSLSNQALSAYLNGHKVYTSLVTTGMPALRTPKGTWHIYRKLTNVTFISMWPPSSPYYYAPEHVNYAMEYSGPLYLHDATWRSVFGPGTQNPHNDPKFGPETGSHGCVNLPLNAAAWLYKWAPIGTTVEVVN